MFFWLTAGDPGRVELRLAAMDGSTSTLIVDHDQQLLVLNANGPQDARAVLGLLSRPWEADPTTIVAGADRNNPEALWEVLQRLSPNQLVIAGAPGADDRWHAIDEYCRNNGIAVSYLQFNTEIPLPELSVDLVTPTALGGEHSPSYAVVSRGEVRVALAMGGLPVTGRFHLTVSEGTPPEGLWTDLPIISEGAEAAGTIRLASGQRLDVTVEASALRISGRAAEGFAAR